MNTQMVSLKSLTGLDLVTADGVRARLQETYLDERRWAVRHLVAECTPAGGPSRCVLVPPDVVRAIDLPRGAVLLHWSTLQLQHASDATADPPVGHTRGREAGALPANPAEVLPSLWGLLDFPLGGTVPPFLPPGEGAGGLFAGEAGPSVPDPHLHASGDLAGYRAVTPDGRIGRLDDLLLDERLLHVSRFVFDLAPAHRAERQGRLAAVPSAWVERIDHAGCSVVLRVGVDLVRRVPEHLPGGRPPDPDLPAGQRRQTSTRD